MFMINLPGVIAGEMLSKRVFASTSMGGKLCHYIAVIFCLLLWGAAYQCAEAPLACYVCVHCVFIHALPMWMHLCVYMQNRDAH